MSYYESKYGEATIREVPMDEQMDRLLRRLAAAEAELAKLRSLLGRVNQFPENMVGDSLLRSDVRAALATQPTRKEG